MRLLLILISPAETLGFQTAIKLAEAALRRGHEITIFGTGDGVENLKKNSSNPLAQPLKRLIEARVRLLVCRESTRSRGFSADDGLMEGVEMSSLAEMVELMDSCDKTLVFG